MRDLNAFDQQHLLHVNPAGDLLPEFRTFTGQTHLNNEILDPIRPGLYVVDGPDWTAYGLLRSPMAADHAHLHWRPQLMAHFVICSGDHAFEVKAGMEGTTDTHGAIVLTGVWADHIPPFFANALCAITARC